MTKQYRLHIHLKWLLTVQYLKLILFGFSLKHTLHLHKNYFVTNRPNRTLFFFSQYKLFSRFFPFKYFDFPVVRFCFCIFTLPFLSKSLKKIFPSNFIRIDVIQLCFFKCYSRPICFFFFPFLDFLFYISMIFSVGVFTFAKLSCWRTEIELNDSNWDNRIKIDIG